MPPADDLTADPLVIWTADQNRVLVLGAIAAAWIILAVLALVRGGVAGVVWGVVFLLGGGALVGLTVTPDRFVVVGEVLTVQRRGRRYHYSLGKVSVEAQHPSRRPASEFPVLVIDGGPRYRIPRMATVTDIRDPRSAAGKRVMELERRIAQAKRSGVAPPLPAAGTSAPNA